MIDESQDDEEVVIDKGWRCLRCSWQQYDYEPYPPFTSKPCGCCSDFECPNCGGAIENFNHPKPEST